MYKQTKFDLSRNKTAPNPYVILFWDFIKIAPMLSAFDINVIKLFIFLYLIQICLQEFQSSSVFIANLDQIILFKIMLLCFFAITTLIPTNIINPKGNMFVVHFFVTFSHLN